MDILRDLNLEQRQAVQHTEGPMLVVAGAGTGKTRVITHRIAYLIANGKAKPGEILALTFTEKAAREMADRLYDLIGWESFQVPVMTFHAFGAELLGRFGTHIGRSIRGGLINDTQKVLLLRQHFHEAKLSYYGPQDDLFEFLERVVSYIGELQNSGISQHQYTDYVNRLKISPGTLHPRDIDEQCDLARLYGLYEEVKARTGTYDYNDQLQLPVNIFRSRPNLAERLAKEFRYVMVDEYQDTNAVQDELLRTFVGRDGNLFAVGDDDQAIYGFRGADIGNILRFSEHFKLEAPAVLVQNYRSGQGILDAAYRLILNNNPNRLEVRLGIDKRLTGRDVGGAAAYRAYQNAADEQEAVVREIAARIGGGEAAGSIVVLAATHAPLKAMAKVLRARGIPFALSSSANIFEQPELIGLWYLLKWLVWQADEESMAQVLMGPYVGWASDSVRQVVERAHQELCGVEDVLRNSHGGESRGLASQLDRWREWAGELPVSQLVYRLVFETGVVEVWRKTAAHSGDGRLVKVFEDLRRLLEQMQDYETVDSDKTLSGYFRAFPKPPTLMVSEPVGDSEGVQLLTVHSSKGLEFVTVFLIGCTQRSWSAGRSIGYQIPEELRPDSGLPPEHEFRRLMYVAVTRARKEIVVSCATKTLGGTRQAVSPFVGELFGEEVAARLPDQANGERLQEVLRKLQQFYPLRDAHRAEKLPFETSDGWLDLSVTGIGSYDYCPFEFYLHNVLQIQQPVGPRLAFGSALHKVFESLLKGNVRGDSEGRQELHGILDELWSERGYESRELAQADRELAHVTLDKFVDRETACKRKVLGSEVPIRFELPEAKLRLRGKIDAIFDTGDGVELRDFKTGRNKTDAELLAKAAKVNFQLRTYALAYQVLNGSAPELVTLDYVVTGVEGSAGLSSVVLRNHRAKLTKMAEGIRALEFAPNANQLHQCAAVKYFGTGEADELAEQALMEVGER